MAWQSGSRLRRRMNVVHPRDLFGRLGRRDVEVYDNRILSAAYEYAAQRLVAARVDLLMRDKWRDIDEVARPRFGDVLEALTPPHPRASGDNVDDALEIAVVMGARFRVRMNRHRAGPELIRARASVRNGGG